MYFVYFFFFFNDTATTEIYTYGHTLSLHDALPILGERAGAASEITPELRALAVSRYTPKTMVNPPADLRSEEHTSELQSLMRISYAVFCLKKKTKTQTNTPHNILNQVTHTYTTL